MKTRIRIALGTGLVVVSLSLASCGADKTPTADAPTPAAEGGATATTPGSEASTPSGSTTTPPAGSTATEPTATIANASKCLTNAGFGVHQSDDTHLRLHIKDAKPVVVKFFDSVKAAEAAAPPMETHKDGSPSDLGWIRQNTTLVHGKGFLHEEPAVAALEQCLTFAG